jgi:superfamily I DNA/RNA helicase
MEGYRYIVDCIESDYQEWAILCRTNKHLDRLEFALAERGIPAARLGGKSIFDSPHAVGFVKLLVGLVFPKAKMQLIDGLGWAGEDEVVLQSLYHSIRDGGFALAQENPNWLTVTENLHDLATRWRERIREVSEAPVLINNVLSILVRHHDKGEISEQYIRQAIVGAICKMMLRMEGDLPTRVKKIYDLVTKGVKEKPSHLHPGKVVLCTMTGSKGLEFPKVFIMMINRQIIPSTQADDSTSIAHIDEERRLLYVAITRAEDELILHWHEGKHSRFIEELDLL